MKITIQIVLSILAVLCYSSSGKAQTKSTPCVYRAISVDLPGEWGFMHPDLDESQDEYMFIATNKDRDRLFVFVSRQESVKYDKSKFESGLNRCLDDVRDVTVSRVKELTFNQQKVYKSEVYKNGELFRIVYGSVIDDIEYYVLLDLLNSKQADQLFQKVRINPSKHKMSNIEEIDKPLSELKEIFPDTEIPKNAKIHEFGDIRIWFDADDDAYVESIESTNSQDIEKTTGYSNKIGCGIAIIKTNLNHYKFGELSEDPNFLEAYSILFLEDHSKKEMIEFDPLEEVSFCGRLSYSVRGLKDGVFDQKIIFTKKNKNLYILFSVGTTNSDAANKIISRVSIIK